jgi:hypothetical protein
MMGRCGKHSWPVWPLSLQKRTSTSVQQVTKQVGLDFKGAYVNLDGGFDSAPNRKYISTRA